MPRLTTTGLVSSTAALTVTSDIQWAVGAGSAEVITAAYDPALTELFDGLAVSVRLTVTNETTTPTFEPDGLGAHTIVKDFGVALEPGDLPDEAILRYKAASTVWVLMNPNSHFRVPSASWAAAAGVADALTATFDPPIGALVDGMEVGIKAAAANATTAPTFSPDGFTARIIKKLGAQALVAGDIYGASHELKLRYHSNATPWWELMNPATNSVASLGLSKFAIADVAGADSATAQPWFPSGGAVTVAAGQAYKFEGYLRLSRAAGAGAHTTGILFAGTATLTQIGGLAYANSNDTAALAALSAIPFEVATETVVKASSTSTSEQITIYVKGIVVFANAGTFIPQFKYSGAPGGVPTVKKPTFFTMEPLNNPQGTWA